MNTFCAHTVVILLWNEHFRGNRKRSPTNLSVLCDKEDGCCHWWCCWWKGSEFNSERCCDDMIMWWQFTQNSLFVCKYTYAQKWQQTREQQPHAKVNDDDILGRRENFHTIFCWLMGGIGKFTLNYYHKVCLWIYFHTWREDNQYRIHF